MTNWTTKKKVVSPRMFAHLLENYVVIRKAFEPYGGMLELELSNPYERCCLVTPEQLDRTIGLDEEPLFNREWAL